MNRRELLKNIGLSAGYVVVAPTLSSVLMTCRQETTNPLAWTPLFLNKEQAFAVSQIADVILPENTFPSASQVNTPQFLDLILNDVLSEKRQKEFLKGAKVFKSRLEDVYEISLLKAPLDVFSKMINTYFNIDKAEKQKIFKTLRAGAKRQTDKDTYYLYRYLTDVHYYTLFGYYTAEDLMPEYLKFNPYTGSFEPCISASELGV